MNIIYKLKIKFKKPKQVKSLEIDQSHCTGCGKCITGCKHNVFSVDCDGYIVPNMAACVGCGKCVTKICIFSAIKLKLA